MGSGRNKGGVNHVNGAYQGDNPIGKLMHDFQCMDPSGMHYEVLAKRTRFFKESEEGVLTVCRAIEQMREESMREGIEQTRTANIAALMKNLSISVEKAMELFGIPAEERADPAKKIVLS